VRGNGDETLLAGVGEEPPAQCDGCGGDFKRGESIFWSECNHALHHFCAYAWRVKCPYCLMEWKNPVVMRVEAGPSASGLPPETDVLQQPAESGPPPALYFLQQYSHARLFGQPPPAAPHAFASTQPPPTGQFGCPPSSQPLQRTVFGRLELEILFGRLELEVGIRGT